VYALPSPARATATRRSSSSNPSIPSVVRCGARVPHHVGQRQVEFERDVRTPVLSQLAVSVEEAAFARSTLWNSAYSALKPSAGTIRE